MSWNRLRFATLPFDIQMFAGEKTEPATEKRREEARERGNIPKSQDLESVAVLLAAFLTLKSFGPDMISVWSQYMRYSLTSLMGTEITLPHALMLMNQLLIVTLKSLAPVLTAVAVTATSVNLMQVGFLFTLEPFTPDIDRLNPISGLSNIFSWKMIAELVKSILKILVVAYIPYSTLRDRLPEMMRFITLEPMPSVIILMKLLFSMSVRIILLLLALAVGDWFFQRWRYEENLKMSKEDIKEEFKQREGDPKVKAKIRERQRRLASRKMMEEVPKATVVVTNPTHIAVALKYDAEEGMKAPVVVAIGTDLIAQRIKEIATEHGVPIIENKPLARSLLKVVDVGDEIPSELFNAVAEILAQVYAMRKQNAA
ncbi:MAG TPA: flagellar biosynthesis protein FlhB [Candidatus Ozemobacteraceae bacterium]